MCLPSNYTHLGLCLLLIWNIISFLYSIFYIYGRIKIPAKDLILANPNSANSLSAIGEVNFGYTGCVDPDPTNFSDGVAYCVPAVEGVD